MEYNALEQDEYGEHGRHDYRLRPHHHESDQRYDSPSPRPVPPKHRHLAYNPTPPPSASLCLFLDAAEDTSDEQTIPRFTGHGFRHILQHSTVDSSTATTTPSYDMLGADEEEHLLGGGKDAKSPASPEHRAEAGKGATESSEKVVPLHIPRPKRRETQATAVVAGSPSASSRPLPSQPIVRTTSGRSIALRHPTPDLQTLQGAYTGNIKHLEETAERLSMTSSIEDAIKDLHDEQKRSDSRRSSLLSSQGHGNISRQISNASSIVEVNSTARSGGYSPAGYLMSPPGSFSAASGRARSASKGSRFGRPEPEMEGRPLDSFVMTSAMSPTSPTFSINFDQTPSIAERADEDSTTMTRPFVDYLSSPDFPSPLPSPGAEDSLLSVVDDGEKSRPQTAASINTIEREKMFEDFDGTHTSHLPPPPPLHQQSASDTRSQISDSSQSRIPSGGSRLSMVRPQSYADPSTGQQMVYYPAPVPMMLNLPQKLSKNPSSMARNKRRSQVMSSIPSAARQSAIWLPDVLEQEQEEEVELDEETQQQEYIPQHQRASMGGRRLTQDLTHMPPQLRASTFFDLPGPNQVVELKEQSAVATLDSILDASAHAPVSAFTDHAFAGALGSEVYGRSHVRNSRSTTLLETTKKRTSSFNLLRGRRASVTDLLDNDQQKRRATMSGVVESAVRSPIEDDSDNENGKESTPLQQSENASRVASGELARDGDSDDEQPEDVYTGPPTTLLAELQLRKQRQKMRTAGLATAFPNGMHSTLLQMDAVAEVEKKTRKQKRTLLAWEDPSAIGEDDSGDDEDVPLAMLYAQKSSQLRDASRPLGLMERRELEDNEPLSRRRDRLQGKPAVQRASTMMHLSAPQDPQEENESLAQRVQRLKELSGPSLPSARPVSGDFTTEIMSQFGGELLTDTKDKGKAKEISASPGPEEEETLGQRRKRLQAEKEARLREVGAADAPIRPSMPGHNKRRSMADILQAHPSAGADRVASYTKPSTGLLGLHEQNSSRRASTMMDLTVGANAGGHKSRVSSAGFKTGQYNDGKGGIIPPSQISPLPVQIPRQQQQQQQFYQQPQQQSNYNLYSNGHARSSTAMFPQPSLGQGGYGNGHGNMYANGMGTGSQMMFPYYNTVNSNLGMQMQQMQQMQSNMLAMGVQPLNQGQIDMVERWRQSVMQ